MQMSIFWCINARLACGCTASHSIRACLQFPCHATCSAEQVLNLSWRAGCTASYSIRACSRFPAMLLAVLSRCSTRTGCLCLKKATLQAKMS